ncbi:MAG: response regulator [Rhodospirillales bacterium]|nr:response regulator [Rhodospirillales bacterium]
MSAIADLEPAAGARPRPRILVVEDEMLIVLLLEDLLADFGCEMVFSGRVDLAVAMATVEALDGALLDVNVAGVFVFPVADALRRRGIPFAFLTGYGPSGVREDLCDAPIVSKPFDPQLIENCLADFIAR